MGNAMERVGRVKRLGLRRASGVGRGSSRTGAWLVGFALATACTDAPSADVFWQRHSTEPTPPARAVMPASPAPTPAAETGWLPDEPPPAPLGNAAVALAWDSRLLIYCATDAVKSAWFAKVVRPGGIGPGPTFSAASVSKPRHLRTLLSYAKGEDVQACLNDSGVAIAPWPDATPAGDNPYRSDCTGRPSETGACATYDLLVVYAPGANWSGLFSPWAPDKYHLWRERLKIVVAQPNAPTAAPARHEWVAGTRVGLQQRAAGTKPVSRANSVERDGKTYIAAEPQEASISQDGRLIVWQGGGISADPTVLHGDEAFVPPQRFEVPLVYSYAQKPGSATGWSEPRNLAHLHAERNVLVDGQPLHERFPLAARPLYAADGTKLDGRSDKSQVRGAYPWMSWDASYVTFAGSGYTAVSMVGALTAYRVKHLDGPINPVRGWPKPKMRRKFFVGLGRWPGVWGSYRRGPYGTPHPHLPSRRHPYGASVLALVGQGVYHEESSHDVDGRYEVVFHMNELLDWAGAIHLDKAGDASHSLPPRTGKLTGGARLDEAVARVGRSLRLKPATATVTAANTTSLGLSAAFSVEAFVRLKPGTTGLVIAEKKGAFRLEIDAARRVVATVFHAGGAPTILRTGPALGPNRWTHVALTYDRAAALSVLIDATTAGERTANGGGVAASTAPLVVGPATGDEAWIDELYVSSIARTRAEVAYNAYRTVTAPSAANTTAYFAGAPDTLGLDFSRANVPVTNPMDQTIVALGAELFADPNLSETGKDHACATCHHFGLGGGGDKPGARKLGGVGSLLRNTQVATNRIFSTRQLWDGRAASLEEQVLMPIQHPDEMNRPKLDALVADLARLRYGPQFDAAFDANRVADPSAIGAGVTRPRLAHALAQYMRANVFGDSRYDRAVATPSRATLTAQERAGKALFFGKARCVGCHNSPTFTDEQLHATAAAAVTSTDVGAGASAALDRRSLLRAFKTPTLRNIALSAPYFHDGAAKTLADVIDVYDKGGRYTALAGPRDHEQRPLELRKAEKAQLEAFLRTLTTVALSGNDVAVRHLAASTDGDAVTLSGELCHVGDATSARTRVALWLDGKPATRCSTAGAYVSGRVTLKQNACSPFVIGPPAPTARVRGSVLPKSPFTLGAEALRTGKRDAVVVVDAMCELTETSEQNNRAAVDFSLPATDLSVQNVRATVERGAVALELLVCNRGSSRAATVDASVWFARSSAPNCRAEGADGRGELTVGPRRCVTLTRDLGPMRRGTYTTHVLVDSACAIAEAREDNNSATVTYSVP